VHVVAATTTTMLMMLTTMLTLTVLAEVMMTMRMVRAPTMTANKSIVSRCVARARQRVTTRTWCASDAPMVAS
jgi:hypothetical protein